MAKEVEIKIKLEQPELLLHWLKNNAGFLSEDEQEDIYFELLKHMGITSYKQSKRGYGWMMWNPNKEHYY